MRKPILYCIGTEEWFESMKRTIGDAVSLVYYKHMGPQSHGDGVIFMPGWAKEFATLEEKQEMIVILSAYGRDCGYRGPDIDY